MDKLQYLISLRAIAMKVKCREMPIYLIEMTLVEANDKLEKKLAAETPP